MENASKAIIIAGGFLLMIMALSLAMFIFRNIGNSTSEYYEQLEQSDIDEFNQKFTKYDEKKDLTIQDVISIVNLAKDNNETGKMSLEVIVTLDGDELQNKNENELNELLAGNADPDTRYNPNIRYKCEKIEYTNQLVSKVEIIEKPHS